MSYKHLVISERAKIENLLELGYSIRKIVHRLNRDSLTISREIKETIQEKLTGI